MTTTGTSLPRQSCSVRYAVVSLPGTAIVRPRRSSSVAGSRVIERRAVAVAHARARGEQGVAVGQVGEGVDADGRDFELAAQGAAVERLDVLELMDEPQAAGVELVVRQGVEHEGVVRVGAVPDPDRAARTAVAHGDRPVVRVEMAQPVSRGPVRGTDARPGVVGEAGDRRPSRRRADGAGRVWPRLRRASELPVAVGSARPGRRCRSLGGRRASRWRRTGRG